MSTLKATKSTAGGMRLIAALLLLLTVALYWRATGNGFVNLDDTSYVLNNRHVITGLTTENLFWAFTSTEMSNWHPLTWVSHMADAQLFGSAPAGHHATSVLLHAANAALLLLLLYRLTGELWKSALVAALFALHPLHVESVAWVSERKDVLSTLFLLLTLISYTGYVARPVALRYGATLLLFACGLMAKPMLVTLPCLLLLLDFWPLGRLRAGRLQGVLLEKVPFLLLSGLSCALTLVAQKKGGAVVSLASLPFADRAANALLSYAGYLGKTLWPAPLVALYPLPDEIPYLLAAGAGALLVAGSAFFLMQAKPRPYLSVGWFWFLGTLVPVIGLVQVGGQAMADRYTYVPHIGLLLLLVWGASELAEGRLRKSAQGVLALGVLSLFAALTFLQIGYWRNGVTLFTHAVRHTEKNALAHYHLAVALTERGRLREALQQYDLALAVEPESAMFRFGKGCGLSQLGDREGAVAEYFHAARLDPRDAQILFNLGNTLLELGRGEEAVARFQDAARLAPGDDSLRNNLGAALAKAGRIEEARIQFAEALRINPGNVWAQENLRIYSSAVAGAR